MYIKIEVYGASAPQKVFFLGSVRRRTKVETSGVFYEFLSGERGEEYFPSTFFNQFLLRPPLFSAPCTFEIPEKPQKGEKVKKLKQAPKVWRCSCSLAKRGCFEGHGGRGKVFKTPEKKS